METIRNTDSTSIEIAILNKAIRIGKQYYALLNSGSAKSRAAKRRLAKEHRLKKDVVSKYIKYSRFPKEIHELIYAGFLTVKLAEKLVNESRKLKEEFDIKFAAQLIREKGVINRSSELTPIIKRVLATIEREQIQIETQKEVNKTIEIKKQP